MMIVHVPADGSQATLISLPRDSYVNIPGYGMNKLNAAYPNGYINTKGNRNAKIAGGADLLIHTIENLTGLNIDHFVEVSLLGFVDISDAVGGVTVNLCHSVDDTVAHNQSIGLSGGSGLVMSKGVHTIKGVQALEFVRQREGWPAGTSHRTARQRYFLTAAFRKVASAGTLLNIGKLQNLITAVDKSIYVDQGLNMLDLAKQMSNLSANNIRGEAIPTDHYANVQIGSYTVNVGIIIPSQVRAFIHRMITNEGSLSSDYKKAPLVDPSTVSVTVRNFGTQNGAAATAASTLDKAKFKASVDKASGRHRDHDDHLPQGHGVAGQDAVALRAGRLGAAVRRVGRDTDAGRRRHPGQVAAEPRAEPQATRRRSRRRRSTPGASTEFRTAQPRGAVRPVARSRSGTPVRHVLRRGERRALGTVAQVAGQLGRQDPFPADGRTRPRRR